MSASDGRLIFLVLLLCFLFSGDPDVWDGLKGWALRSLPAEQCVKPDGTQDKLKEAP